VRWQSFFLASRETSNKAWQDNTGACAMYGAGTGIAVFTRVVPVSMVLLVFAGLGLMLHSVRQYNPQTITDDVKREG
jgi:TRAP-type mannitol/chloroaromatic compound transport system permease small subunit